MSSGRSVLSVPFSEKAFIISEVLVPYFPETGYEIGNGEILLFISAGFEDYLSFIHHDERLRIIYDVIKKGYNELRAEYGIE